MEGDFVSMLGVLEGGVSTDRDSVVNC